MAHGETPHGETHGETPHGETPHGEPPHSVAVLATLLPSRIRLRLPAGRSAAGASVICAAYDATCSRTWRWRSC